MANILDRRGVQALMIGIALLPLVIYAYNGTYMRLLADDYCFAVNAREMGVVGAMVDLYNNWTATFSSSIVQGVVGVVGPGLLSLLPTILIALWCGGLILLVREFCLWAGMGRVWFVALFMGPLLLLAIIDGLPNTVQGIYWTSGTATYISPMILLSYFGAILLRVMRTRSASLIQIIIGALLLVVAGGFAPTYAVFQLTLLVLLLGLNWFFAPKDMRRALMPLLIVGTIIAGLLLVMYFTAPGTAIRAAAQPDEPPPLIEGIGLTIIQTLTVISAPWLIYAPFATLAVFLISGIFGYYLQPEPSRFIHRRWRLILLVSFGTLYILVMSAVSTTIFVTAAGLPARSFTIPQMSMVLSVALWGYVMGYNLRSERPVRRVHPIALGVIVVLLVIGPLWSAINSIQFTATMTTFAQEWDERALVVREAGANGDMHVTVEPFTVNLAGIAWLEWLGSDPNRGHNQCAAEYFGVESLRVLP